MASINSPRGGITLMIPRHGTLRRDPAARSFKVWNIASYALDLHSMSLFVRRSFKQTSKETRLFPWTHLPSSFFQHFGPFPRSFIISHLRFFLFFFFIEHIFICWSLFCYRSMRNNCRHETVHGNNTPWPLTIRSIPLRDPVCHGARYLFSVYSRESARTNGRNAGKLNNDLSRRFVHRGRQQ